jgi:hypothetical protein
MRNYDRVDLGKSFKIFAAQLNDAKTMIQKDDAESYARAFGYLSGCAAGFITHFEAHHEKDDLPEELFKKPGTT